MKFFTLLGLFVLTGFICRFIAYITNTEYVYWIASLALATSLDNKFK